MSLAGGGAGGGGTGYASGASTRGHSGVKRPKRDDAEVHDVYVLSNNEGSLVIHSVS